MLMGNLFPNDPTFFYLSDGKLGILGVLGCLKDKKEIWGLDSWAL